MILDGVEYVMSGDLLAKYSVPRTGDTWAAMYPDITDWSNVQQFANAFVRDALIYEAKMDGISGIIRKVSEGWWTCASPVSVSTTFGEEYRCRSSAPSGGTTYQRYSPGYNIAINENWHDRTSQYNTRERAKIQNIYHEMGHALMHKTHTCEYASIMKGGGQFCAGTDSRGSLDPSEQIAWQNSDHWKIVMEEMFDSPHIYQASPFHPNNN